MKDLEIQNKRNSFMEMDEIYFWTATIHNWRKLLLKDDYKEIIIDSLKYLVSNNKIKIYAFVIMPNHVHFIWKMIEMNGKESPHVSFLKHTAHAFKKKLIELKDDSLTYYKVNATNKKHEFWQRDSLAILLYTPKVAYQKLDYLHNNPLQSHWNLVDDSIDYLYSSIRFYESQEEAFLFLSDLRNEFGLVS
jgi:putative transposase